MNTYKVLNLSETTSESDRSRLGSALRSVPGVHVVTLSPSRREFSLSFRGNAPVARTVVEKAVAAVGFVLEAGTNPWVR